MLDCSSGESEQGISYHLLNTTFFAYLPVCLIAEHIQLIAEHNLIEPDR